MSENTHILEKDFLAFQYDLMNPEEKEHFLEHISSCNNCSDHLATFMSKDMITAPRDLKANILKATKRPEVQIEVKARETSKQIQLFLYSLKVGTATIGALLLLLMTMKTTDVSKIPDIPSEISTDIQSTDRNDDISLTDTIRKGMNTISNSMLDFSNNIMKTEVTIHDQKER